MYIARPAYRVVVVYIRLTVEKKKVFSTLDYFHAMAVIRGRKGGEERERKGKIKREEHLIYKPLGGRDRQTEGGRQYGSHHMCVCYMHTVYISLRACVSVCVCRINSLETRGEGFSLASGPFPPTTTLLLCPVPIT